jgi:hypothetical protein
MWDCHLNCELDLLYNLQSDADRREASCCTHAIAPGLTLRRVPGNPMIQTQIWIRWTDIARRQCLLVSSSYYSSPIPGWRGHLPCLMDLRSSQCPLRVPCAICPGSWHQNLYINLPKVFQVMAPMSCNFPTIWLDSSKIL